MNHRLALQQLTLEVIAPQKITCERRFDRSRRSALKRAIQDHC